MMRLKQSSFLLCRWTVVVVVTLLSMIVVLDLSSSFLLLLGKGSISSRGAGPVAVVTALSTNNNNNLWFQKARPEVLNLLNHPLQLQLVTGELQLGAYQRLINDRKVILEGLLEAVAGATSTSTEEAIQKELKLHHEKEADLWITLAQEAGKTIVVPDMKCYNCGGEHLNIDCPEDQEISSSAQALKSLLCSNGIEGAMAVLQGYGFCCHTLLEASRRIQQSLLEEEESGTENNIIKFDPVYHEWLQIHADRWSVIGEMICAEQPAKTTNDGGQDKYNVCLSMLYNWIDAEAATTGIRSDIMGDPTLVALGEELEQMEPGYASTRDKHQSFVADITGLKSSQTLQQKAQSKVDKAAAYLAAKKKKNNNNSNSKLDAAAAYLAAKKKKKEQE